MKIKFAVGLAGRPTPRLGRVAEAVADRISWKYALGWELEHPGFDHSVLSEFRARLAEPGRANAALEVMLARLTDAGLVKAGGRQRTDSSHVIACVRRLNRIETCGESLRAALEEIAAVSPGFVVALLKPAWDAQAQGGDLPPARAGVTGDDPGDS